MMKFIISDSVKWYVNLYQTVKLQIIFVWEECKWILFRKKENSK